MRSAQQRIQEVFVAQPAQRGARPLVRARAAGRTDAGRVRPNSEDQFLIARPTAQPDATAAAQDHVGDSRCYLLRGGRLHQLTRDHTLVQEMVRAGHLSEAAAARHRLRHVVTNAIGGGFAHVEVEACRVDLERGDLVLLCTDGLTGMVPEEGILAILEETGDVALACDRLIDEANARGGRDNVTALVARLE